MDGQLTEFSLFLFFYFFFFGGGGILFMNRAFHSRDKERFCITKELKSHRIDLVHQHGRLFIV